MEEQRIGVMYLNLLKGKLEAFWHGLFPKGLRRSSALPFLVITLLIVVPLVGWMLHRRGKFGNLKREIKGEVAPGPPAGPRPGGLDPILLSRNQTVGSNMPEFHSATLLPGLGMQILQITVFLPNRGEVSLLASPKLEDIANGTTPQRSGPNDRWGAIEAPWAGVLTGVLAPLGTTFRTNWRGHTIEAPTDVQGRGVAEGGILNSIGADSSESTPHSDGSFASATFRGSDFDGHWSSKNDVAVTVSLSSRTMDLAVVVKNVGDQPEPMGIGWHPRFIIPSGNRDAAEIRLPNGEELEIADKLRGIPSGRILPADPATARFQVHPALIGPESLDESLVHLKPALLDTGASAELRDPESEFGLRMTAISSTIRALRVTSPAGSNYASLGMQTNLDDPLGKEWNGVEGASIATLMPGQTAEWKIRLEIFSVSNHPATAR